MKDQLNLLVQLISRRGIDTSKHQDILATFASDQVVLNNLDSINSLEMKIVENWEIYSRSNNFENLKVWIPNGTVGEIYEHVFPENFFADNYIKNHEIKGLDNTGVIYDKEKTRLYGTPTESGSITFCIGYNIVGESDNEKLREKNIEIIVNPDPKTLWKDIPSDTNLLFWKDDNQSASAMFEDRRILISSKRGRSHGNIGSCRDDDFAFKHFEKTRWTVVAVADGAGSASFSRKGSEVACKTTVEFFEHEISKRDILEFENHLKLAHSNSQEKQETIEQATIKAKQILYKCSLSVHKKIHLIAKNTFNTKTDLFNDKKAKAVFDYFHSTLIFTAFKKFDFGYVFLSFGVGDCPIAIISKDKSEVNLLNYLDVGEYGGGTRFITQPEIFHSKERPMEERFNLKIIDDYSFVFLMTDGIYDAKFIVEANLEKMEKWKDFLKDLEGENEDRIGLGFSDDIELEERNLNKWMDFWSKGNHDDRTLAIIY